MQGIKAQGRPRGEVRTASLAPPLLQFKRCLLRTGAELLNSSLKENFGRGDYRIRASGR
jgi:hypothetical protein